MVKREGKLNRAGIQLTSQLGNTLNGGEAVNGKNPEELKKDMSILTDLQQQSAASDISGTDSAEGSNPLLANDKAQGQAAMNQALDPNGELGQALQGGNSSLDLSKVPQDQKDFLLKSMMLMGNQ